jgi:hypothetical protein
MLAIYHRDAHLCTRIIPSPSPSSTTRLKAELHNIERQIFDLEGSYLEETLATGNVLRGWDVALKSTTTDSAVAAKTISKKINREVCVADEFGGGGMGNFICNDCKYSQVSPI